MRKLYFYFVSFEFTDLNRSGIGRCEASFSKEITSLKDIEEMERMIRKENDFSIVTVMNFSLLRVENDN